LSWLMTSDARGARQTAYQIQVATSEDRLAEDKPDLWDSSRVESSDSALIPYAGKPLVSRTHAFWRVRLWDEHDQPSPWSDVAQWSMGLLRPTDWRAQWIGEDADSDTFQPANNGYHSEFTNAAEGAKWIVIDLGAAKTFDEIRLCPARPYDWREDVPGFMFPIRFRVESANNPEFADATKLVDRTAQDVPNPGVETLSLKFDAATARYVRLHVTKLGHRGPNEYGLSLAEMEVLRDGVNLAHGAGVSVSDSIENNDWSRAHLVDGDKVSHGPRGMNPLTPPLMRRAFPLRSDAAIRRAMVYVTAQGLYALRLNGERVGDHQLAPEWTDYNKRIQYQTYDVTSQLRAGGNVFVAQLADGWFAGRIGLAGIAPGGRPRAFYGRRPRLLLQMEIEYDDGDRVQLVSDESWRFTTEGPLRQADLLDGDIYDARRRIQAVDSP
ncbi:MAG: alpha-L-rhamnosidase N-terminal domain-containing protein, partial [Phycisphaerales bacterium]|nr:alpha-L-rhamnosidase N-terminal domain-containing protein [Phycisphaerales bacterium]